MALSKLPSDTAFEALRSFISDFSRQNYQKEYSILIAGKFGVGKSSLVNALVGKPVAMPEGRSVHKGCASEAKQCFCEVIEGIKVQIWDSPGLQDGTENDDLYLADIQEKLKGEVDLVIYCLKMDDRRFYLEDRKAIIKLTETFGKELWEHTVIALTFANKVEDPAEEDQKEYFTKQLELCKETIHSFFTNKLNIGPELLQFLPVVPTGYYLENRTLPNCKDWLTEFWTACYSVARSHGAFNLVKDKDNNPSKSPDTTPPSDDGSISLRENEEETFLKRTWRIIKERYLLTSAIGVVATVVYAVLSWFRPKSSTDSLEP